MESIKIAIIGGGASGLILANALADYKGVALFERSDRLGRKLSATGNGQGNLTNLQVTTAEYFSLSGGEKLAKKLVKAFDETSVREFFKSLGVLTIADGRGRVYPASRQASSLTDGLRFALQNSELAIFLETRVTALKKEGQGFLLTVEEKGEKRTIYAEKVVLCAGGKAAKNFGTDGTAYALAEGLGHTVTRLYPSLVQLKTEVKHTKTLKGLRINDGIVRVVTPTRDFTVQGDVIFTDYGVSGDATFRLSAFIAEEIERGDCTLYLDLLPDYTEEEIYEMLTAKRAAFPRLNQEELLFGIVNNQVGRAVLRRAEGDLRQAAKLVKAFSLSVTGSLGFDYAQVTKGGIPFSEVQDTLESKLASGLFFAGEMLDIDGQCGGFNLQWAYASARVVAQSLAE